MISHNVSVTGRNTVSSESRETQGMAPRPAGGVAAEASVHRPMSVTPIPDTLTHSTKIPISAAEKVLLPLISSLFVRKLISKELKALVVH